MYTGGGFGFFSGRRALVKNRRPQQRSPASLTDGGQLRRARKHSPLVSDAVSGSIAGCCLELMMPGVSAVEAQRLD